MAVDPIEKPMKPANHRALIEARRVLWRNDVNPDKSVDLIETLAALVREYEMNMPGVNARVSKLIDETPWALAVSPAL